MDIKKCVENISTITDLKRVAAEYVIDFRRLSVEELKSAIVKTAPQYYNIDNINKAIQYFILNPNRNYRILFDIFVFQILLDADDFTEEFRITEDKIIAYEQNIIDEANEYTDDESGNTAFYKFVLEAAWEQNNDISVDEQNLINKIRRKMKISRHISNVIEAKINKYPTQNNVPHSKDDICEVRRALQQKGIIFPVRDSNGIDYDVIPSEIANSIRAIYSIDIKKYGMEKMLNVKFIRNKKYLLSILNKAGIELQPTATLGEINSTIMERGISAHKVLGGFSPLDGLDKGTLSDWCAFINLPISGNKPELIDRIIEYYDNIKQIDIDETDERQLYYEFFDELAHRNLKELRQQNVIEKDLECEHKFELATNYLFEKKLKVKPLIMSGSDHADGMLSFNDKLILWDNKSKESDVNLLDHISQFDRYIRTSEKPVSVFLVIAPSFTEKSASECAKYSMQSDTLILLITAAELKDLAEAWSQGSQSEEAFPLGYFKQNGRFNKDLISI